MRVEKLSLISHEPDSGVLPEGLRECDQTTTNLPLYCIGVLKAALRLVESCRHIPENSPALQKLRDAVYEVTAELEVVAPEILTKNTR
jgi:hypothetical protein